MKTKNHVGLLFITFPVIVQIPFGILVSTFNYPDVLREQPARILDMIAANGFVLWSLWMVLLGIQFIKQINSEDLWLMSDK